MLIETLKTLFERDLRKLKAEIELYNSENAIWHIERNIPNSAGNLALHLVGNLNGLLGRRLDIPAMSDKENWSFPYVEFLKRN